MKKTGIIICLVLLTLNLFAQNQVKNYVLKSPNEDIQVKVQFADNIYYAVEFKEQNVIDFSAIAMKLENIVLGDKPELLSVNSSSVNEDVEMIYGHRKITTNHYNELKLSFKSGFSLVFRAYNNGVAYRFETNLKGDIKVYEETVEYRFPSYAWGWFPDGKTNETSWTYQQLFHIDKSKQMPIPVMVEPIEFNHQLKVAITEADLLDYPSLLLKKSPDSENNLVASFAPYPTSFAPGSFNNYAQMPATTANFIAKTKGTRSFPWRLMIISDDDKTFVDNDLVYLLSKPLQIDNTDWIQPGQVAWDWWHDYNIEGADFETGINTKTYLYHIDFAAANNVPYINIDWKWTDAHDIFLANPDVDMQAIMNRANEKGVKVIVWCVSHTLDKQLQQALDYFERLGVAGIKVDFFDREDQLANQMYERIAREAAKRHLIVDFHGCSKPTGLHRAYPNILNYEAVKGLEGMKWGTSITPDHDVNISFLRQLCGPFDYTPGAMRNFGKGQYKVSYPPGSSGTRTHQLAMYVVYYQPLVMLCDMPTSYEKEKEFTDILTSIPTTWDETKVLEADAGKYVVVARKKDDVWYVGGMSNWDSRLLEVKLDFLPEGNYEATIVKDGVNATKLASEYVIETITLKANSVILMDMKRGGGYFMILKKK